MIDTTGSMVDTHSIPSPLYLIQAEEEEEEEEEEDIQSGKFEATPCPITHWYTSFRSSRPPPLPSPWYFLMMMMLLGVVTFVYR